MRISDWSSDVCSSDLGHRCRKPPRLDQERAVIARRKIEGFTPLCRLQGGGKLGGAGDCDRGCDARCGYTYRREHRKVQQLHRRWSFEREKTDANLLFIIPEERRVGKDCGSPVRSRWSPYH